LVERGSVGGASLSARDSMKGTIREGSSTGDLEKYVKQGSEMGVCFHRGLLLGNMEGRFFLTTFLLRGMFMRFSENMQNTL
jgi:hypothetical protein